MTPDSHLLIVDDDERIRTLLQKFLIRNGFLVSAARDSAHARRILSGLDFDLIILDVMMPGEDGISLTKEVRKNSDTPILLLTAKGETQDRILGLEAGADDYLAKPFEPKELLLRLNAILRRVPAQDEAAPLPKVMHLGQVHYDVDRGEMWQGEDRLRLTATESQLMRIFSSKPGGVMVAKHKSAQSMCKSQGCGGKLKRIRNSRAIYRPYAVRDICWFWNRGMRCEHKNNHP